MAAQDGHTAAVSVLVGAGAEIDTVNDQQCKPLFNAVQNDHREVLAVLMILLISAQIAEPVFSNHRIIKSSIYTSVHLAASGACQFRKL